MPQGKYGSPTVGGNTNERLDKYRSPNREIGLSFYIKGDEYAVSRGVCISYKR